LNDFEKLEFCFPMKVKWIPFRKCEECNGRKLSTTFYEVHDQGLNSHIDYNVCKKCMKEAKERAKNMRDL
jgi:hypothetical protein